MENNLIDKLSTYLIENTIGKSIGVIGGSFKPPQSGHFQVVKEALNKLPNIDEFIIFVGTAVRDGITQEQSVEVWEIYKKYLSSKVKIIPTQITPIRAIYDFAKKNQGIEVNWVIGIREGQEEDKTDYKRRTSAVDNYPNLKTLVINTEDSEISGTNSRIALKKGRDEFEKFIPNIISKEDRNEIWEILSKKVDESEVGSKDDVDDFNFKHLSYIPYFDILMPHVKKELGEGSELYNTLSSYFMVYQKRSKLVDIIRILKQFDYFDHYKHLLQLSENQKHLNLLKESLNKVDFKKFVNYINEILEYCCNDLGIERPKVILINNEEYVQENKSFGGYQPGQNKIYLVIKNRNLADVCRTLVHETKHAEQDSRGVLTDESGKDGSEHENECNSYSGKIMREFGRKYPKIFGLNNG